MTNAMTSIPAYDENDPRPYVDAMIRAAFAADDLNVTAIEHDDENETILVTVIDEFFYECEIASDDDATILFRDINDSNNVVRVVLFPDA